MPKGVRYRSILDEICFGIRILDELSGIILELKRLELRKVKCFKIIKHVFKGVREGMKNRFEKGINGKAWGYSRGCRRSSDDTSTLRYAC